MSRQTQRDTPYFEVLGHKFCSYCRKPIQRESGYDDYDPWEVYYCNCDDAQKDADLREALKKPQKDLEIHQKKQYPNISLWDIESRREHALWEKKKEVEIISNEIVSLEMLNKA